jgi:molybdate transport system substrate-binding protein
MFRVFLCALFGALLVLSSPHRSLAQQQPVTVVAAASLQDALTSIAKKFTDKTGVPVRFSFGSSAALARQIDEGAPADLFASADVDWMDWAVARNLIKPQTRVDLLGNRLVVVAPFDAKFSTLALERNAVLAAIGQSRLAIGEVNSVPAGLYAKSALEKLGLSSDVQPRLAQCENVRAALALVALGEASLGIVYETDARAEPLVKVVATFPPDTHAPIVYPFALTASAKGEGPARFLAFLQTDAARTVFTAQGFIALALAPVARDAGPTARRQ